MVDVVSEFNIVANVQSTEIFEILFNSLIATAPPNANSGQGHVKEESTSLAGYGASAAFSQLTASEQEMQAIRSKEVIKSCKQIVDCLIANVLNTEANTSSPQAYKRLVASFSALFLLSKIKPDNFINHAETLLPYLNIKSTVFDLYFFIYLQ